MTSPLRGGPTGGVSSPPVLRVYPPASDNVQAGLEAVLAGSYDVPGLTFLTPPRILDLGAHVGSFSVWAAARWPGAKITAYEPHPESFGMLVENVQGLDVKPHAMAIVGEGRAEWVKLYEGATNTGQRSLFQTTEQQECGSIVPTMRAAHLPPADILKADTEGCEFEILLDYPYLTSCTAVMLEWHSRADYDVLPRLLTAKGFRLVRDDAQGRMLADRNLVFVR
jgi:FkbM family methyltransferase